MNFRHKRFEEGQAGNLPNSLQKKAYGNYTAGRTGGIRGYTDSVRQAYGLNIDRMERKKTVRTWLESFRENERFERFRGVKRALMAAFVVAFVVRIYAGLPIRGTILVGLAAAASLIGWDAGRLFSRILASKSRYLIAISFLVWAWVAVAPVVQSIALAFSVSFLSVFLIWAYNLRWISAEVYKRSPIVQAAMQKVHSDEFEAYWESTGQKIVRTLWYDMGLDAKNVMYDPVRKATFFCGYAAARKFSSDIIQERNDLKEENARLQAELDESDRVLDEDISYMKERENILAELEQTKQALEEAEVEAEAGRKAMAQVRDLLFENGRLKAQVLDAQLDLQMIQTEKQAEDTKAAEQQAADDVETKLAEARAKGYGVSRAAKYAGCTHHKAQKFYERMKKEEGAVITALPTVKEA